jgi:hypothetical protein
MSEVGSVKNRWLTVKYTVFDIEAPGATQSLIHVLIIPCVNDRPNVESPTSAYTFITKNHEFFFFFFFS